MTTEQDEQRAREIIEASCGEVVDFISGSETMIHWRVKGRLVANISADLAAANERIARLEADYADTRHRPNL